MLTTLLLAALFGLRHAVDPDHMAAIGALVARDPRASRALRTAVTWGAGHTVSVVAVGVPMAVLGVRVPDSMERAVELLVALMLFVLGALAIVRARRKKAAAPGATLELSSVRAFVVGSIHGLGGSAALTLMALATVGDAGRAVMFLLVFGVGTVLGMALATLVLARSVAWMAAKRPAQAPWLERVAGMVSIAAGIVVLVRVGLESRGLP
ncbi:MAG: HupE/UreJ family protein [Deltaproteobacteria bacterium]|nr:HupE/UreJ family protein [Deltaproteobacteria bacterium]